MPVHRNSLLNLIGPRVIGIRTEVLDKNNVVNSTLTKCQEVVRNLGKEIREEAATRMSKEVIRLARINIKRGYVKSRYPHPLDFERRETDKRPAQRLSASLRAEKVGMRDVFVIRAGEGIEYARIHDRPKGEFTRIHAKNAEYLSFPNRKRIAVTVRRRHVTKQGVERIYDYRKIPKKIRVKSVARPGTAFLSRAVDRVAARTNKFLDKAIQKVGRSTGRRFTSRGAKIR